MNPWQVHRNRADDGPELNLGVEVDALRLANAALQRQLSADAEHTDAVLRELETQRDDLRKGYLREQDLATFTQRVINAIGNLVVVVDTSGKLLHVNNSAAVYLGLPLINNQDVILDPWLPEDELAALRAALPPVPWPIRSVVLETARSSGQYRGEHRLCGVDGIHRPFLLEATLLHNRQGKEEGAVVSATDISAIKNLEAHLREAKETAERATGAKSEFLSNMSHEIRTPMNGILGLAQLLEREQLAPYQRDMVHQIRETGRLLLSILNDILDFSKIEAGQLRIDCQPFVLKDLFSRIDIVLGTAAREKGLEWRSVLPENPVGELLGDALRIEQVLLNLISNAIKFTERGGVRVDAQISESTETMVRIRFGVHDTGIGIGPESVAHLFTPFTQADPTVTRRFGGTGLGLSICKRLIELMEGAIGVESAVGSGSTFWFELPFQRSNSRKTDLSIRVYNNEGGEPRLTGLHCLVVDDSSVNRLVIEKALIREGAHATLAVNGVEALQQLKTGSNRVDAVLMDVQMPVMDGLAATRAIRHELGLQHLPVIALTAGVLAEQREQARAAGCNDFVAKPVDLEALVAVVLRWTSQSPVVVPLVTEANPNELPTIAGLDTQEAASLLGDDRELFLELLNDFAQEFGSIVEAIRADLARDDWNRAAGRLHGLRGAAGYIGALDLVRSAQSLETAILEKTTHMAPLFEDFECQLSMVLQSSAPWRK